MHVGRHHVDLSNEDKVLFPDTGITKGDLVRYYRGVAKTMLRHLAGRPIALQRFPDGIAEGGFYQKQVQDHFPDWVGRVRVHTEKGEQVHAEANDAATLVFLADQASITLHHWLSRSRALHRPDRLVIDLDPQADDFQAIVSGAREVRTALDECGLVPFVQTTGSRGLHVVAPITPRHDFDDVRAFATGVARLLAARHPHTLTTAQRKAKRGDKLFLDVARNAYGQTAVAPYSVRAREGAPVAAPLAWDELGARVTDAQAFTIASMPRRLGQREDPWKGIGRRARGLARPRRRLRAMLREAGVDGDDE